jgi:hypothetical protein
LIYLFVFPLAAAVLPIFFVTMNSRESEFEANDPTTQLVDHPLVTIDGAPYEINDEGSLGLLAMGYEGIMLWRNERNKRLITPEFQT